MQGTINIMVIVYRNHLIRCNNTKTMPLKKQVISICYVCLQIDHRAESQHAWGQEKSPVAMFGF